MNHVNDPISFAMTQPDIIEHCVIQPSGNRLNLSRIQSCWWHGHWKTLWALPTTRSTLVHFSARTINVVRFEWFEKNESAGDWERNWIRATMGKWNVYDSGIVMQHKTDITYLQREAALKRALLFLQMGTTLSTRRYPLGYTRVNYVWTYYIRRMGYDIH